MDDQNLTLNKMIQHWNHVCPEKEVFIFLREATRSCVLTVKDIYTLSGRFASRLRDDGLKPGDVVCNALSNSPERVITEYGIQMAGCIPVTCPIAERSGQDFWIFANSSQCKALILPAIENHAMFQIISPYIQSNTDINGSCIVSIPKAPSVRKVFYIGRNSPNPAKLMDGCNQPQLNGSTRPVPVSNDEIQGVSTGKSRITLMESLEKSEEEIFIHDSSPDDIGMILTTSGTTGYTKLVAKTHRNLLEGNSALLKYPSLKFLNDFTFGWLGGASINFFANCSSRVLQDLFYGPVDLAELYPQIWDTVEEEDCEVVYCYPKIVNKIAESFEAQGPRVKSPCLVMTGQPVTKEDLSAALRIAHSVFVAYGSSELGGLSSMIVDKTVDFKDYMCGQVAYGVKIRIVDENYKDLPQGKTGNILAKSPSMFHGYYNKSNSIAIDNPFTPDGYFITGDRGKLDDECNLYIYGRNDEVINQNESLVSLSYIEEILKQNPDVKEVIVVKIRDRAARDHLCACVVPRKNSGLSSARLIEDYEKYFFGKAESGYYYPAVKFSVFYDKLPVTYNGKPDKKRLKLDSMKQFQLKSKH